MAPGRRLHDALARSSCRQKNAPLLFFCVLARDPISPPLQFAIDGAWVSRALVGQRRAMICSPQSPLHHDIGVRPNWDSSGTDHVYLGAFRTRSRQRNATASLAIAAA